MVPGLAESIELWYNSGIDHFSPYDEAEIHHLRDVCCIVSDILLPY